MRDDVPADVPTFRGVAAPIGRRPSGRKELDEPVVPRRGNHRSRPVPDHALRVLRDRQPMEGFAPQMKNLVRADGPAVDVDGTPYGLPSATSGDMYLPGAGVARQLEGVAPRRVFGEQRHGQAEVVEHQRPGRVARQAKVPGRLDDASTVGHVRAQNRARARRISCAYGPGRRRARP